ncbi:flagellar basal body L-ring protein FlgH [bacterium]|nr:flagellar basal body L-ring protein FlgH [bacterium]
MKRLLVILFTYSATAWADSLLDPQGQDLYAMRPLQPGELVTVIITDRVSTSQEVNIQNQSESNVDLPIGKGLLKLFLGGGMNSKGDMQRKESASSQSQFQYTVTARVASVEPGNVIVLEARNSVELDGKLRELELRGRVRRQDIGLNNSVSSDRLADAQVLVDGAQSSPTGSGFGIFDFLLAPFR